MPNSGRDAATLTGSVLGLVSTTPIPEGGTAQQGSSAGTPITGTTAVQLFAAAGGSKQNYLTDILITNSHATVATVVQILDGATVIWEGNAAAVNGGWTKTFSVPLVGSANTAMNVKCVTNGASVNFAGTGYNL